MLRDGALSHPDIIRYINKEMVPVWINVRSDRFPRVPAIAMQDWELMLVGDRRVTHPYFYFFYIRSFVFSPNLEEHLNDDDGRWAQVGFMASHDSYLSMLKASVARYREQRQLAKR